MSKTPQSPNNCSSPKASHPSDLQTSIVFCEKDEEIQTPLMPSPDTNVINAIASSSPTVKRPTPTILFQNIKKRKQHSSVPMKINLIKKHRKKLNCFWQISCSASILVTAHIYNWHQYIFLT